MLPPNQKCVRLCQGWRRIFADALLMFAPRVFALQVSLGFFRETFWALIQQNNVLRYL